MISQNNLPEVHGEFLSKRVQMWNRPDTNVELLDLNVQFRIGIVVFEVGFVYFTKEMCVCVFKSSLMSLGGALFFKTRSFCSQSFAVHVSASQCTVKENWQDKCYENPKQRHAPSFTIVSKSRLKHFTNFFNPHIAILIILQKIFLAL